MKAEVRNRHAPQPGMAADAASASIAPAEMTAAQRTAVQAAIANAATLEEVQRLEAALSSGQLPSGIQVTSLLSCYMSWQPG